MYRCDVSLTGEPSPAGDVAGGGVGQDQAGRREAGGADGGGEGDGRGQFDEGDVVTGQTGTQSWRDESSQLHF